MGRLTGLQKTCLAEHKLWCEKACDINVMMQKNGRPEDLPLGTSIVDYALDRLLEDVSSPKLKQAKGDE